MQTTLFNTLTNPYKHGIVRKATAFIPPKPRWHFHAQECHAAPSHIYGIGAHLVLTKIWRSTFSWSPSMRTSLGTGMSLCVLTAVLSACGGGGGSGNPGTGTSTGTGTFLDSPVAGLSYTCGSSSGTTDASGHFTYDTGSTCTFKIGGVTLGSAPAKSTLTPVSIVSGATDETNPTVTKLAQLLQTLDADSNPSNGITIDSSVTTALASSNVTIASGSDVQALVTQAYSGRTLVNSGTAQTHLQGSILTQMAGTYSCSFSGGDSGSGTVTLAANGSITGSGSSNSGGSGSVSGTYSSSGSTSFTLGSVSSGATFSGSINVNGSGSGSWSNSHIDPPESGSWTCSKTSAGSSSPAAPAP